MDADSDSNSQTSHFSGEPSAGGYFMDYPSYSYPNYSGQVYYSDRDPLASGYFDSGSSHFTRLGLPHSSIRFNETSSSSSSPDSVIHIDVSLMGL